MTKPASKLLYGALRQKTKKIMAFNRMKPQATFAWSVYTICVYYNTQLGHNAPFLQFNKIINPLLYSPRTCYL